mgnify:CR=1 FL=1
MSRPLVTVISAIALTEKPRTKTVILFPRKNTTKTAGTLEKKQRNKQGIITTKQKKNTNRCGFYNTQGGKLVS